MGEACRQKVTRNAQPEMEEVSLQLVEELNYESMRSRRAEKGKDTAAKITPARPA